jgi:hypothetical protein
VKAAPVKKAAKNHPAVKAENAATAKAGHREGVLYRPVERQERLVLFRISIAILGLV